MISLGLVEQSTPCTFHHFPPFYIPFIFHKSISSEHLENMAKIWLKMPVVSAKMSFWGFQPLSIVGHYRDP